MKLIDLMLQNTRKEGRRKGGGRAEGLGLKNFDCIWTGGGAAEGRSNTMFFKVPDVVFYDSSMLRGLAEGRRKGGGRAAQIKMTFSKVVILNGIWIGGRAAEGRRKGGTN